MKKIAFLLAALMLLTAGLAGCGGSDGAGAGTPDDSQADAQAPTDAGSSDAKDSGADADAGADAAGEGAVDRIKAAGKIVMLTNAQFPPFEYTDDAGNPVGVDPDLAQAIADELGVELEIVDMDFDGLVDALKANKGDFIAAGFTISEERMKEVDFSVEYVTSAQMVVIPKGSDLAADDAALSGKTISVQEGTTGDFYASGDQDMTSSTIADANVLRFKSGIEAGMAVASGKADAMIIDELPATKIVEAQSDTLELLPTKLTDEQYAFAVNKGCEDLLEVINKVLGDMAANGKVDELVNTHMGV